MRRVLVLGAALATTLTFASAADATVPAVFSNTPTPISCSVQSGGAIDGQRFCTGASTTPANLSTVASWDGTPIDVSVALPPVPASGPDGNFPVVGLFHGYGGSKIKPTDTAAQRWLAQGYAVYSITDRGFWGSCGVLVPVKPAACAKGYIHLMSNAYEVRDAQYLLGLLADQGVIDPQRIGANGGSYGGGMSLQLAALKDRVQLPGGTLIPWRSPNGTPMRIAAAAPEYGWSDLLSSLQPNGSTLDYAAENPYVGPDGDRRFGIEKQLFTGQLYAGGAQAGYYAPVSGPGFPDPTSNITAWKGVNDTGGPYDGNPLVDQQIAEFPNHGAAYTDDRTAPAPTLLSNGWNDDLFPVDEAIRFYNRVRTAHPDAPITMFHLGFGHSPRGGGTAPADYLQLVAAENAWFDHYVKGNGDAPADAEGGVDVLTSACSGTAPAAGTRYHAKNWASLAPGEIRVEGAAAQTVSPASAPTTSFQAGNTTVCSEGPAAHTNGAAVYTTAPAPSAGFTIAGSPTVVADLTVAGANDALISRLYDVDPIAGTEKLIARGVYRPTGVGQGPTRQVFQLFPQAYAVAAGHVVKLELLGQDAPYVLPATGQQPIGVSGLELRLPTIETPGALAGLVQEPAAKILPAGYAFARDARPAEPPVTPPVVVPTPPAETLPSPLPVPTPVLARDPLTTKVVRAALGKPPKNVRLSRDRRRLTFTDSVPEAGRTTYGLSVRTGSGSSRRTTAIGSAKWTAAKPGSSKVTFRISSRGRAILARHPKATLIVRTYFVTGVEQRHVNVLRKLRLR